MSAVEPSSLSPLIPFSRSLDPFNASKNKRKEKEDYSAKRNAKKPRVSPSTPEDKHAPSHNKQDAAKALQQLSVTIPAAPQPIDSSLHKNTQMIRMSIQDYFGLKETIESLRAANVKLFENLGDTKERYRRLVVEQVAWSHVHDARRKQSEQEAAEWKAKYEALLLKMPEKAKESHAKSKT